MGPDHLSAYGLTLDEGSLWHARGVEGLPPEETVTAQYWALARAAAAAGFEHYEVSNYAAPASARATTSATGAGRSTWPRAGRAAASSATSATATSSRWSATPRLVEAGQLPIATTRC